LSGSEWNLPRKVKAGQDGDGRKVWRAGKSGIAQQSREVIVRVTGRTRNPSGLAAQLSYNTRKGELAGEMSNGRILQGMDDLRALRDRWVADNAAYARRTSCPTQSLGVVLSMPTGTPHDAVVEATRVWARQHISPTTEWFAVQHADRSHFHSHVAVRAVQVNGYRVAGTLPEIQSWRETFAQSLRQQGVMAEATPRREKVQRILAQRQELQDMPLPEMRLGL